MGRALNRQRGVSLIEVLIAVLVFSLGLVGLASLMVVATQSNHSAYLRTQAGFVASNMADRMRANQPGLWADAYNESNAPAAAGTVAAPCGSGAACTVANVAVRDKVMFDDALKAFLPNAQRSIKCVNTGATYTPNATQILKRVPYSGSCTMRISWVQRGVGGDKTAARETFAWVFKP